MERLIVGDIVVVPFPFSDLSGSHRRPALIVATLQGDDVVLCQITGQNRSDRYAVLLSNSDFEEGSLNRSSNIRTNRLFTASNNIIAYKVGKLNHQKRIEVKQKIEEIFDL
ncbi:MAG: type II toxin-antitoxin system PemK/MazF family toxin [Chitinophagales bacterium]